MLTYEKVVRTVLRDAAVALGSVVMALLLVFLLSGQIGSTVNSVVAEKKLTASLETRNDVIAQLRGQFKQVEGNEALIRAALPSSSNVLEFVSAVESIAAKDNVEESIRFDVPRNTQETVGDPPVPLEQVEFTQTVQGNIFTFIQYLNDMELLPYFANVTGMTIGASANGGWQNTSTITLHGVLYTAKDEI